MTTVVIIARDPTYPSRSDEAFRECGLFVVVVNSAARALVLLAQFQANVLVVERGSDMPTDWEPLLKDVIGKTPLITYEQLPSPRVLATSVREVAHSHKAGSPA